MKKSDVVRLILKDRLKKSAVLQSSTVFAPTNIALCKYWGKRDQELNLPNTSSLSVSLGNKGTQTTIRIINEENNIIVLNGKIQEDISQFTKKLNDYLNLFGRKSYHINIESNIPIAAGLASSACGFAALILALNKLYNWELNSAELSILSRLGSGSASRSIENGFVEWHRGERDDGMDSFGQMLPLDWPDLCIGLAIVSDKEKPISSRIAMQRTIDTSLLYKVWPAKVEQDLMMIKEAIKTQDLELLGKAAESNALTMHATMLAAWPPINYALPQTIALMQKIWQLREESIAVYFTQDAGPNLKLIFLKKDEDLVKMHFPTIDIVQPFLA